MFAPRSGVDTATEFFAKIAGQGIYQEDHIAIMPPLPDQADGEENSDQTGDEAQGRWELHVPRPA